MSHSQTLDTSATRPPPRRRLAAHTAVGAARLLAHLPPRRLQRSLATALLCRIGGTWLTWCTGVRTLPFAAHAWVEAQGRRVGEPADTATYRTMLTVAPR